MAASFHRAAYDGDGVRRKRDDSNGIVHYLGGYERKLAGGSNSPETITKYYSASLGALSRSVAFRRGGTLHWVGSDHLGGTVRVLDDSFTALDGMRYRPYGEDRDTGSSLNTDRKFTGQTEDEAAGLYWYASRAYDPEIGRFVSPDSIVPAPGNPQSLNRYSYVYNNPLGLVDPTGYVPQDQYQAWVKRFEAAHQDREVTERDWLDYQFSLEHPGTGPNGTWTKQNWVAYSRVRQELGDLIEHVGTSNDSNEPLRHYIHHEPDLSRFREPQEKQVTHPTVPVRNESFIGTQEVGGPDGTTIVVGHHPIIPPGNNAITLGDTFYVKPDENFDVVRARVIHEYVHVLQWRKYGVNFVHNYYVPPHLRQGAPQPLKDWLGLGAVDLEQQAQRIQRIYRQNPWLPAPWLFPLAGR